MKLHFTFLSALLSIFLVTSLSAQQMVEGTWSYRTGPDGAVSDPLVMGQSSYYRMVPWDSSPYKEYHYHKGSDAPNQSNFGMNFRLLYPNGYDENRAEGYPLIILLHGLGEAGTRGGDPKFPAYDATDPRYLNNDYNLYNGGKAHLNAVNTAPADPRSFPGFVFIPQNEKSWNVEFRQNAIEVIELLIKDLNIDEDRVYLNGLSNGGKGAWSIAHERPDLFAAFTPISWVDNSLSVDPFIYMPIWHFQGELDGAPKATSSQSYQRKLKEAGATSLYTEYENAGHGIWDRAYAESNYFSWLLGYRKTDIHAKFGQSSVCPDDEVNVTLGVTPGFTSYQWKKVVDGKESVFAPTTNNELVATEIGTYYVKLSRSGKWTSWSRPFSLQKTVRPDAPVIAADGSTVLPSPDGKNSVNLSVAEGYDVYKWYKNGILLDGDAYQANVINVSETGNFTVVAQVLGNCKTKVSKAVSVIVSGEDGQLSVPTGVSAKGYSETEMQIAWDNTVSGATGYNVFRTTTSGNNYVFAGEVDASKNTFIDKGLNPLSDYYYIVFAYNESGASNPSAEVKGTTLEDLVAPSNPYRLSYELVNTTSAALSWDPAVDKVGVAGYDIFQDGQLVTSVTGTSFTVTGLQSNKLYNFVVKAKDYNGNVSEPSNQLTVITRYSGLNYTYYFGDFWDYVADYAAWTPSKKGNISNFNIDFIGDGGVRPDDEINYFAFDFEGYIYIDAEDDYEFNLTSSDGSLLFIDGAKLIDNDGKHDEITKSGTVHLTSGEHAIKVQFFDNVATEVLKVAYSGADTDGQMVSIPDEVFKSGDFVQPPLPEAPSSLVADNWDFTQINLSWTDNSTDETGFELYRSTSVEGPYSKIKTTESDVVYFEDKGLEPNTQYYYQVKSISNNGSSAFVKDSAGTFSSLVWTSFEAAVKSEGVELDWSTAREVNNAYFEIGRSSDNIEYIVLDTIAGAGYNLDGSAYTYLDDSPLDGDNYYRLRQIDDAGNYSYSGVDSVYYDSLHPSTDAFNTLVYPIPLLKGQEFMVELYLDDKETNVSLRIMDSSGHTCFDQKINPSEFSQPYSVPLISWKQGLYLLEVRQGGNRSLQRFVIY